MYAMKSLSFRLHNGHSGASASADKHRTTFPATLNKVGALNYIRALVDLGFVSFMIPYRITWTGNGYKLIENRFHKGFCLIFQTLVVYEVATLSWLMFQHRQELKANNTYYIPIAHSMKCGMLCLILIYTFWIRKLRFLDIIRKIQKLQFLQQGKTQERKTLALAYGIFIFGILWAVAEILGMFTPSFGSSTRNLVSERVALLVNEARALYLHRDQYFFPGNRTNDVHTTTMSVPGPSIASEDVITPIEYVVTIIHSMAIFPHYVCVNSVDKLVLLIAICGRSLVSNFVLHARMGLEKIGIDEILAQYEELKSLVAVINESMGLLIFCFIGACLPLYPTWSGLIFSSASVTTTFQYVQFVTYFGLFFVILGVGADMNSKIGEFYRWIATKELESGSNLGVVGVSGTNTHYMTHQRKLLPASKLTALMMDMYSDQIALRGGSGFFRMNYSFFGTVLGIIVTYTVISIQLYKQ